jgi:membrane protein DedA with SNARE-associated domain
LNPLLNAAEHLSYLAIFGALLLASLGVPIPEETPIITGAVLVHEGLARWWLALPVCIVGVVAGDIILYWIGRHWGETVVRWRIVRWVLTRQREERLKAAYQRHAVKTIVAARHVMGLRAAAFLTAGIVHVPFRRFLAADGIAAFVGVTVLFGLAYFFTDRLRAVLVDIRSAEHWLVLVVMLGGVIVLVIMVWRRSRRLAGE